MKKAVTFRIDRDLLEQAKQSARLENRSLTNFIETLLKARIDPGAPVLAAQDERSWSQSDASADARSGGEHGQ